VSDHEKNIALREAAKAGEINAFFKTRPDLECPLHRIVFGYGFIRSWAYRQPEIDALTARVAELEGAAK